MMVTLCAGCYTSGTSVNQNGCTATQASTFTAPNGPAQERTIRTAMERAGSAAREVAYVEAHGTGTPLGDPQEVGALAKVFRGRQRALVVGAVKTYHDIGHLEGAAGMAGLIKAVLCRQHRRVPVPPDIPPSLPPLPPSLQPFPKSLL
eukprot:3642211-Rhodomonas_salina.3